MRTDAFINDVLATCEVMKKSSIWPAEPIIRPRAWLQNFEDEDKEIAALLLDKFRYYNCRLTDKLFIASYHSIGDGLAKGPSAPASDDLIRSLSSAVFTPVTGEIPNPTDSGYFMCRKARQILDIPQSLIYEPDKAFEHASKGKTVVFLDDFIGSGDQFLETWMRKYGATAPSSFHDLQNDIGFTAIYISLVATDYGLSKIHTRAPSVAVCATHILEGKDTIEGLAPPGSQESNDIKALLLKYSSRLQPDESYMKRRNYLAYGYKERGLLFGFEHSIPDATLPIYWSPGNNWEPLVERR